MPKVDFSKVEEAGDFTPIPENKYLLKCTRVETTQTRAGDEMWNITWQVQEGDYTNRLIWDRMVWNPKAYGMAKANLKGMGFDVSGELDIQPSALDGIVAYATVYIDSYVDADGNEKRKNAIRIGSFNKSDDGPEGDDPF